MDDPIIVQTYSGDFRLLDLYYLTRIARLPDVAGTAREARLRLGYANYLTTDGRCQEARSEIGKMASTGILSRDANMLASHHILLAATARRRDSDPHRIYAIGKLEKALRAGLSVSPKLRVGLLGYLVRLLNDVGRHQAAASLWNDYFVAVERLDDPLELTWAWGVRADLSGRAGDFGVALDAAERMTGPTTGFGGQWGYYADRETGIILCTHRYYDPSNARWLNREHRFYLATIS